MNRKIMMTGLALLSLLLYNNCGNSNGFVADNGANNAVAAAPLDGSNVMSIDIGGCQGFCSTGRCCVLHR